MRKYLCLSFATPRRNYWTDWMKFGITVTDSLEPEERQSYFLMPKKGCKGYKESGVNACINATQQSSIPHYSTRTKSYAQLVKYINVHVEIRNILMDVWPNYRHRLWITKQEVQPSRTVSCKIHTTCNTWQEFKGKSFRR